MSYTRTELASDVQDWLTLWLVVSPILTLLCWVGLWVAKKYGFEPVWPVFIPPILIVGSLALTVMFYSVGRTGEVKSSAEVWPKEPPLFEAIDSNDVGRIKKLLAAREDIDGRNQFQETPALKAAIVDRWIICLLLLQRGASVHAISDNRITIAYALGFSVLKPESDEGKARAQVLELLKQAGVSIPPPRPQEAWDKTEVEKE